VLPEAAQGPQVAFAAPGAELAVARSGESGYVVARGTSFAAPAVAGLLSESLAEPDAESARRAIRQWQQRAIDLGMPGRDDVYGWGLLDWIGRASPQRLHARRDAAF
jgi:subtilisin family serine protease